MKFKKHVFDSKLFLPISLFFATALLFSTSIYIIEKNTNTSIRTIFDTIWLSIVTMSTTGYGEIVPTSIPGRIITLLTIIIGILSTSLLTGTIATIHLNQISRSRRGLMNYSNIKGHIIICGWREHMAVFLSRVVESERIDISKIIVIADVLQEQVDEIFETPRLDKFKFVRGNVFDKNVLLKANVKHARKAIVLSDQTHVRSVFEVDSRTVMAVIAIKSLHKQIHVTAQLLERNFEMYLQRAQCDEILFSKEINTELLSLVVQKEGMSNVIGSLLGGNDDHACLLNIVPIKPHFFNKEFQELEQHLMQEAAHVKVLGILENTGRRHEIVDQAIRYAQKTADFPKMLENLRQVRDIKPFKPVLIPDGDYKLKEYSAAIVLERKV